VKRLPHPTDGRAALVELTDDGVRAAAALAATSASSLSTCSRTAQLAN
jgi:DNA-binding MarR family transcriptional regulator